MCAFDCFMLISGIIWNKQNALDPYFNGVGWYGEEYDGNMGGCFK